MGVWQVRGQWVIRISGRCSGQLVGKPPFTGNFIRASVLWRISNPLNFCHRTILLDRNSLVWVDTHGTLVGAWPKLIRGWQTTNRSVAGVTNLLSSQCLGSLWPLWKVGSNLCHWVQVGEASVAKMAPTRPLASRSFCLLTLLHTNWSLSNLEQRNTRA